MVIPWLTFSALKFQWAINVNSVVDSDTVGRQDLYRRDS